MSLDNDEIFSPINLLLCSLIEYLRCLITDGREVVREIICPLVPLMKRTGDPVQTAGLCADIQRVWKKKQAVSLP